MSHLRAGSFAPSTQPTPTGHSSERVPGAVAGEVTLPVRPQYHPRRGRQARARLWQRSPHRGQPPPRPGTEQCQAAREDVTHTARSRSHKAELQHQERGVKSLPCPLRGAKHRQPRVSHPTARPRSPTDERQEIRPRQQPVPQAGNKRTTGNPPARRTETRQGSESIRDLHSSPHRACPDNILPL